MALDKTIQNHRNTEIKVEKEVEIDIQNIFVNPNIKKKIKFVKFCF